MSVSSPPERKRKKVGVVSHISSSTHMVIAKAEDELGVGDFVYDEKSKRVGSVFDFFGSVNAPFIAVKPFVEEPEKLIGENIYVMERDSRLEDRRYKKKRR